MSYHLTMLAYDMNDEPLTFGHGAPCGCAMRSSSASNRSRVKGIEFVATMAEIGGGYGGYNEDHEFFGYRQSI